MRTLRPLWFLTRLKLQKLKYIYFSPFLVPDLDIDDLFFCWAEISLSTNHERRNSNSKGHTLPHALSRFYSSSYFTIFNLTILTLVFASLTAY